MFQLYIANKNYSSWSLRPWLVMRQLGIPFAEHLVQFAPNGNWESFRKFSPTGRVPCLIDGANTVWDSLGIVEYLAERHPGVWPSDSQARAFARCASAEMHSGFGALRGQCSMSCGVRVRLHALSPELLKDVARIDELWSEGLRRFGGPFLAGASFSAVDAFYAPVVFRVQSYGLKLGESARGYASHMLGLPRMREWYEAALSEAWREPGHEAEIASQGTVIEDLRRRE